MGQGPHREKSSPPTISPFPCMIQLLSAILAYLRGAGGSKDPVLVDSQASKLTVMVMTFEARLITLKVWHGASMGCPSHHEEGPVHVAAFVKMGHD